MKDMKNVKIPALHISGWWDGDGIGTKMNWAAMRALKRHNQYLIYGPWTHFFNTTSKLGDEDYGPDSILELESVYLRWFDHWLKGKPVLGGMPKVKVFVTGANEWRVLSDWPDPRSKPMTLYLGAKEPANGKSSRGELTRVKPAAEDPDRYTYNPAGLTIDEKELDLDPSKASTIIDTKEAREDILHYKSEPLNAPIDLGGPIRLELYFSSSAVDTDFFALLEDIDAKGAIRAVGQPGKMRAKYWKSFDKPELLEPGRVYKLTLDLWDTAHRFGKGHRIGLMIRSEMFPSYARNLNTGEPIATGTRMLAANQTVYHDARHPSALRFMVLPPKR
jgi:putative CocE/NonD family hydrolase